MERAHCIFLFNFFLMLPYVVQTLPQAKPLSFLWAFVVQSDSQTRSKYTVIRRDTVLTKEERVQFFVKMERPAYLYIFRQMGNRDIRLLFPKSFSQQAEVSKTIQTNFIPHRSSFLRVGEEGDTVEVFYLIASSSRLSHLEKLYERHTAAPRDSNVVTDVVAEIIKLRAMNANLATVAEKPMSIAGTVRSIDEMEQLTLKVEGKMFYARAIKIGVIGAH